MRGRKRVALGVALGRDMIQVVRLDYDGMGVGVASWQELFLASNGRRSTCKYLQVECKYRKILRKTEDHDRSASIKHCSFFPFHQRLRCFGMFEQPSNSPKHNTFMVRCSKQVDPLGRDANVHIIAVLHWSQFGQLCIQIPPFLLYVQLGFRFKDVEFIN